jgi:hypothetical protein
MEWLWAAFAAMWTLGAASLALCLWRVPDRWRRAGKIDNGLGMVVDFDPNHLGTRVFVLLYRGIAPLGFAMALGGVAGTFMWIGRAI